MQRIDPHLNRAVPKGLIQNEIEQCGIPAAATVVAFNFTVTGPVAASHLTVWPAGGRFPGLDAQLHPGRHAR
jgi:hypothetical protein